MEDFEKNYKALNAKQRKAVDTIDGPVMVVAGPGTGKTQLLSMRVANILQRTDMLPSNILCLTFTESGATEMRERLHKLIGQPSYGVAVHTFHSFGAEIINNNPDHFYQGAYFRAADELSSYEVLQELFKKLPHDSPLASTMNGEFTALRDAQKAISDLKKASLTPDELLQVLDHNEAFITYATPLLQELFAERLSNKRFSAVEHTLNELSKFQEKPVPIVGHASLAHVLHGSLERALENAKDAGNTKPLGEWRANWLEKDVDGNYIFKEVRRHQKLRGLSGIYYDYLVAMQKRGLYDFDDMILRVAHGMEVFNELRLNLQERYQYILVDEFQDTNGAQMRLLWNLTNNEASAGRPNIMVVGDDDQAIYRFQGADISNILSFNDLYTNPEVITLTDNYRSTKPILEAGRQLVTQVEERLENSLEVVNKTLTPNNFAAPTKVGLHVSSSYASENVWLAAEIKKLLKNGTDPNSIAVIGRNHAELKRLVPYLYQHEIPITYERQDNVLESPPILLLEQLARVIVALNRRDLGFVAAMLPQLLSHPAWGVPARQIWELSLASYTKRQHWLEMMLTSKGKLHDIAEWLIETAKKAEHEPLEHILDILLGTDETLSPHDEHTEPDELTGLGPLETYHSPLRAYFFSKKELESGSLTYFVHLNALSTIRQRLREYQPDKTLFLEDFSDFISLHRAAGITIPSSNELQSANKCVQVMTAHKSKGREFDTVFVVGLTDNIWGTKSRGRGSSIAFPHNLPIAMSGDRDDERIRLLFVAMTRAKRYLYLSLHQQAANGKEVLPVAYLETVDLPSEEVSKETDPLLVTEAAWHEPIVGLPHAEMKELLTPILANYKLSATHLNNFVDVTRGGPQSFLLQNLLRFPQAPSPQAAYGSAIHATLQRAHAHLSAHGKSRPVEDLVRDFEHTLRDYSLSQEDFDFFTQRGADALQHFLSKVYDSFTPEQLAERNFSSQGVVVEEARLSGLIDLIDLDEKSKTITVTDYKTGKTSAKWLGVNDFEKIKLHKYRQQLLFYKLLIENSREFGGKYKVEKGVVCFVEPDSNSRHVELELTFDSAELERFKKLIKAVWQRIQKLDLPDISDYELSYKGILKFEEDLITDL